MHSPHMPTSADEEMNDEYHMENDNSGGEIVILN
jgi:hypothetical protein